MNKHVTSPRIDADQLKAYGTTNLDLIPLNAPLATVARQSGWEHSDNQDGHFGGRGGRMIVAARR
jgi:hypothetical protein